MKPIVDCNISYLVFKLIFDLGLILTNNGLSELIWLIFDSGSFNLNAKNSGQLKTFHWISFGMGMDIFVLGNDEFSK